MSEHIAGEEASLSGCPAEPDSAGSRAAASMAEIEAQRQQANGVSLTGAPTFDQDLYGAGDDRYAGYERSIGLAEEEDERSQFVER